MGKCGKVCFGIFSILAIADIIAFSIMYSPVMNKERHNNFLKSYKFHQDCLVYNESNSNTSYTLKVDNKYYQLNDVSSLKINSTIDCFISPLSNISYLSIDILPNQIALIFLLTGMLGLFIVGSLIRVCVETGVVKIEGKKLKSKIANLALNSIQEDNNSINGNNLYSNPDGNNEKTQLLPNDDLPKFYDISLIKDEYEEAIRENYMNNNNNNNNKPTLSNLKCNLCNKSSTTYLKICLQSHHYCRGCIMNLDKDICILCQKPINFKNVKFMS